MRILQIEDLYTLKFIAALNKIRNGEAPNILENYCAWNEPTSRRWYQIKTPCKIGAISRLLPQFEQANKWNKFFTDQNSLDIDTLSTKKLSKRWKQEIIDSYYQECDLSKCYSCKMQKIFFREKFEKDEQRREEIRKINFICTERENKMIYD